MPRFTAPVVVFMHHYRHRLADPDNLCGKAVVDAIVAADILSDDTAEQVQEVRHHQTKIGTKEEEKTVVTIVEVVP